MSVRAEAAIKSAEVRRRRLRRLGLRLAVWVGLPTVLAIVYYGLIAAPQYHSVAVVAVQSAQAAGVAGPAIDKVLPPASSDHDGHIVREYILSREMARRLVDDHDLVRHYSSMGDWFSSLDPDAPFEEIFAYYTERIQVAYRSASGTMTLQVRAFSPEAAQAMAEAILGESRTILDRLAAERSAQHIDQGRTALITISRPSLPDVASYPRRIWGIVTVFVVALALMAVIGLFAGAVREHAKL